MVLAVLLHAPHVAFSESREGEGLVVLEALDGDAVVIDRAIDDATQVRLVGIQAPKAPREANVQSGALAEKACKTLASLIKKRGVTLRLSGRRLDRHGCLLAHVFRDDDLWVQGEMLRRGMAQVYTFADHRERAAEMLALEREARAARRDIWADSFYRIRSPQDAADDVGSFQLVGGRALDAARVKSRIYLNFGSDWRTDFTISISTRALSLFDKARLDLLALKGQVIRVRGWLDEFNGPMIDVTHPEQVEIVTDVAGQAR